MCHVPGFITQERDQQIIMGCALKMSLLCCVAIKTANMTLKIIRKGKENKSKHHYISV